MNIQLIFLIGICLFNAGLGLVVFVKNPSSRSNQAFGGFIVMISGWLLTNYFSNDQALTQETALIMNYATFLFPVLTLYFLFLFVRYFTGLRAISSDWFHRLALVLTIFVSIISCTPLVIASIHSVNGIYQINFGPLAALYAIYMLGILVAIFASLWKALRVSRSADRTRFLYVLVSLFFGLFFSAVTNLVVPFLTQSYVLTIYGPFSTVIIGLGFTYAIVRHRLFDIRLVIARSIAYTLLLATLAALYGFSLFAVTKLFFTGSHISSDQQTVYIVLALILAFTFQPLRRFFERITDRIFYRSRYDSQMVLAGLSSLLVSEFNLDSLLKRSLEQICRDINIGFGQFIIYNKGSVYRSAHHGTLPDRMIVAPQLVHLNKAIIVADELEGGERKATLEDHGLRLSALLRTRDEVVGYLLLGDKLSGDIYSGQDIEVIGIMAKELAVAISNAKAYAEIQAFANTLQERVNHATSRLRVANRHLKELDQAKDEFLSLASHQLRTPLTTIKGYLSMILEGDAGKLSATQKEFTEYAFDGSERMVRLISDLLDVSRMSAGRFVIQPKATDVNEMMRSEVQQLQSHAEAKGLHLTLVAPAAPLPPVMLDENKTRQVIMNFVDNAIYYTEKGSVTALLSVKGNKIHVEVRDTGMGVPPEAQKHLFSKFYRANNAQKSRPDGTGLGLFLAKRVIEDQGGSIIFSSVLGKGSIFGFELPLVPVGKKPPIAKPQIKPKVKA
jgi:signal transduction histidine kinase